MRFFTLTRLRWQISLALLGLLLLPPVLLLLGSRLRFLDQTVGGAAFVGTLLLVHIPGLVFRAPLFAFHEFGAVPQGVLGWMAVFAFWAAVIFALSWPANFWRSR